MAGKCKGAYLLAIFAEINGAARRSGTAGTTGITGVGCKVYGGVGKFLWEVDEELGEVRVI